jgi:hypothetical protein
MNQAILDRIAALDARLPGVQHGNLNVKIDEAYGHPWDFEPGWSIMTVYGGDHKEVSAFVKQAYDDNWRQWARTDHLHFFDPYDIQSSRCGLEFGDPNYGLGLPEVTLFRPNNVSGPWSEWTRGTEIN